MFLQTSHNYFLSVKSSCKFLASLKLKCHYSGLEWRPFIDNDEMMT